ncbi:MAG: UvrD-helicase domain-containing protein, partial [Lachnospiraceae bacterium]|nr:UvrD-helicase domain-containing protein [Lachnospiraceae bacterium]
EYQDTNFIQEKLIAALSLDFKKKNVFMVGDIKQGIYRFRHAELSIFADKYDLYNGNRELGEPITLDENYRSRKEILMYVNDLFSKIMKKNYGRVDYAKEGVFEIPESSMESATSDETKVEVVVINKESEEVANLNSDDNEEDSDETIDASNESSKDKNNYTESDYEGDYVARRIRELVDSGKYDYKDIVILHRAAGTKGKYFLDALTRYHIPVYSEQKKGFFDRQEVKLIISILNVIDNPLQNIHVASVITSNIYNISNEELAFIKLAYHEYLGLSKKDDYMLYDALVYLSDNTDNLTEKAKDYNIDLIKLQNRINMFLKMVDSLSFKSRYLSISELINLIYEKMNVRNITLAMRDGKMRAANLEVLYKFARNYENSSYVGLFNFLRYIEKIKQLDDDTGLAKLYDENDNVVKIMTVHSSKGLEFKVVFMCGTGNKYNEMDLKDSNSCYYNQKYCVANKFFDLDKKYSINTPKREYVLMETADLNRQEELRVLYVALTRAKEKLIIVGFARETRLGGYSIAQLNEFKENFANGKNMPSLVKDCNCYLDLILKNYPTSGDYCIFKNESINLDLSEEKAIDEFDFSKINQIDEEEKKIEQNKNYKEYLQKFSEESLLNTTTDNYEYRDLQKIEPKFSVSSIKQRIHDTLNNTQITFVDENLYDDADVAIEDSVAKTIKDGTIIGNAYHRYMQFYNYTANKYD